MTDEEVLAAALSDSAAQPLTSEELATMKRVSPVKVLRQRLGMTLKAYARHCGLRDSHAFPETQETR